MAMQYEAIAAEWRPWRMVCAALVVMLAAHTNVYAKLRAPAVVWPEPERCATTTAEATYPALAACLRDDVCTAAVAVPLCTRSEVCAATLGWLIEESPTIVAPPIRHRTLGLHVRYLERDLVGLRKAWHR
jgi:hypothetical protein